MKFVTPLLFVVALGFVSACAKPPPPPAHSQPTGALPLASEARQDRFDCPNANCVHWYRINAPGKGKLRVSVEVLPPAEKKKSNRRRKSQEPVLPPGFEITLSDGSGKVVAGIKREGETEGTIEAKVTRGFYFASVWSEEPGRPFDYRVNSKFKAAPKPRPKPKPKVQQYEARPGMILEAEGWGTDVTAVLIDLGSQRGMVKGMKAKLIDGTDVIAQLVIDEVFPDGSRLTVEGELSRPLGTDARVDVMIPIP